MGIAGTVTVGWYAADNLPLRFMTAERGAAMPAMKCRAVA